MYLNALVVSAIGFASLVMGTPVLPRQFNTDVNVTTMSPTPEFSHLYTAYADVLAPIYFGLGPAGIRTTLPCVGGNVTSPFFKAKILNSGADFGVIDPHTGIFKADTRYNLLADDGSTFMISTMGPQLGGPLGDVYVAVHVETGALQHYWMNQAIVVGHVRIFDFTDVGFILRLDTFYWNAGHTWTTFSNGTTVYANGTTINNGNNYN